MATKRIPASITRFYVCPGKCRKEDIEGDVCEHGTCDYSTPLQEEEKKDENEFGNL